MPAKSPEAIARKRRNDQLKRVARRAKNSLTIPVSKTSPEYRRKLPKAPVLSKEQMRQQITQAVLNTGGRVS